MDQKRDLLGGNGTINGSVVRSHGDVHNLGGLESSTRRGGRDGDDLGEGSSDGEDAGLRRVDDGGEVRDAEHSEVRDGERSTLCMVCARFAEIDPLSIHLARNAWLHPDENDRTHLVLLRLQLAVSSLGSERLGLGRDGSKTLGSDVLDDGGDESSGGSDGDTDVGLLVPTEERRAESSAEEA